MYFCHVHTLREQRPTFSTSDPRHLHPLLDPPGHLSGYTVALHGSPLRTGGALSAVRRSGCSWESSGSTSTLRSRASSRGRHGRHDMLRTRRGRRGARRLAFDTAPSGVRRAAGAILLTKASILCLWCCMLLAVARLIHESGVIMSQVQSHSSLSSRSAPGSMHGA